LQQDNKILVNKYNTAENTPLIAQLLRATAIPSR